MGDKFSFAESYENYEKSNFKEGTIFLSLKFMRLLFDGNPEVITTIGCVTNDRLRESPPPEKCKHNASVVFEC